MALSLEFLKSKVSAYGFAIEEMLSDHDIVDRRGILKGQKGETSGSSRVVIAHDGAGQDAAELRKVVGEALCQLEPGE